MMNIHRKPNLPAIRVHDHNTMDTSSDHHSSPHSQRTLPRDIPIPKYGSPTSSRGGSMHGSLASQGVPPILSLDPPTLPPPTHHPYHHDEPMDWVANDGSGSIKQRRAMAIASSGGREGSDNHHRSPRGWATTSAARQGGDPQHEPPGVNDGISIKREKSLDKSLQDVLFRKIDGSGKLSGHMTKELQGEESLRAAVQKSVKAYDTSLVRKLNSGRSDPSPLSRNRLTPPRDFRPFTSGSEDSALPPLPAHWQQPKDRIRNLPTSNPIPIPGPGALENPFERWAHSSGSGDPITSRMALVPEQNPPVFPSSMDFRNSGDNASVSSYHTDNDAPSNGDSHMRRSISASILGPGYDDSGAVNSMQSMNSYDAYGDESDIQMDDTPASHVHQMRRLTLHEARTPPKSNSYPFQAHHQRAGSKRRASSPPNEDRAVGTSEPTRKGLLLENGGSDLYNHSRRTPPIHHGLRTSPSGPSKYHTSGGMHHSPVPRSASGSFTSASASSGTTMWSASIGPFSAASSITTADRGSPATSFSPPSDMDVVGDAPFRQVSTPSSNRPNNRQRILSETAVATSPRERDGGSVKHHSAPKMGLYICECCPKKPKKFENYKDLRLHEMEKQYSCQYCNNRFKNKNEAERHQNSLHLRKHSWSCAALSSCEAAFHQSPQRPNSADICGYCGKEFSNPPQWRNRIEHLMTEHKFGECNQSKKFYRADHFRQHLKHSHSGTSGKWTNLLENACMRDEIPPTIALSTGTAVAVISEESSD